MRGPPSDRRPQAGALTTSEHTALTEVLPLAALRSGDTSTAVEGLRDYVSVVETIADPETRTLFAIGADALIVRLTA